MTPDDLDWDLRSAIRRERVRLLALGAVFVGGAVVLGVGWTLAGTLLMLAGGLGFVSRVLVGMLRSGRT